jgi:hypothetical protein
VRVIACNKQRLAGIPFALPCYKRECGGLEKKCKKHGALFNRGASSPLDAGLRILEVGKTHPMMVMSQQPRTHPTMWPGRRKEKPAHVAGERSGATQAGSMW